MTDTEKAIEWFKENLPPLEDYGEMIGAPPQYCGIKYVYNDPCGYMFETAIQALQEKAEREKGCSFCNDKRVVSFCATSYHSSLEPITIIEDLYFGFCPHCGRKLTSAPTDER